jgi:hypothetical protein
MMKGVKGAKGVKSAKGAKVRMTPEASPREHENRVLPRFPRALAEVCGPSWMPVFSDQTQISPRSCGTRLCALWLLCLVVRRVLPSPLTRLARGT